MSVLKVSLRLWVVLSLLYFGHLVQSGVSWNSSPNRTQGFFRKARQADSPAPIDCKLKSWSPWTPCNSCTEKTLRFQFLERPSQFGGTECVHSQWDEKLCPVSEAVCELPDYCEEMYTCPETGRCISHHLRCNGEWDCGFGGDEDGCEEVSNRETKCDGMLRIPGAEKATQGYNILSDVLVNPVLDPKYFGGVCEYIYNGEWRQLTYDAFCENLHYNDAEKYFRKPHNFLSYRLLAHSTTEGSSDYYSDAASLLKAMKTESSGKVGRTLGIYVEVGVSVGFEHSFLTNITKYNSKDVGFIRLMSRVETAHFKMRSRDLMLDEDMLQSLMELPEHYDFGLYSRFLNEYGTHYITHGVMGGLMNYVIVVNKEVMKEHKMEGSSVGMCFGISLGLPIYSSKVFKVDLKVKHDFCKKTGSFQGASQGSNVLIRDVIGYVKGGITGPSAQQLAIHDANSYRKWGKSLKHNPAVIEHEVLPIYELVRFSTVADQFGHRLPLLKQAWEEYLQQFNPCRCAPCRNNGIPVLSRTACSCLCKEGYSGLACERTSRKDPTNGGWSCWSSWTPCLSGTKTRRRECNNPPPKNDGFTCQGSSVQLRSC